MIKRLGAYLLPLFAAAASAQLSPGTEEKLDALFTAKAPKDGPGLVVGVVKDGRLVYSKGFGLANLEQGTPLNSKSVIDVGSVTKHFTATALVLLEDEGKLSLDDEVQKWIPSLPNFGRPITIRRLLNHTSGLRDYFTLLVLKGWQLDQPLTTQKVLDLMADQRDLNFPPGSSFNYCNTGYVLASEIVKRASKESLDAYLKRRVFTPLGMKATTLYTDTSSVIPGRVESYRKAGTRWTRLTAPQMTVGDGGLLTTIEDFAKWDAALKGGLKLKKGSLIDRLTDLSGFPKIGAEYGLGLFIDKLEGIKRINHGGDWLGFNAQYSVFPEKGISIMTFANEGTQIGKSLNNEAAKLLLGIDKPAVGAQGEVSWPAGLMGRMEGDWVGKVGPTELKITFRVANAQPQMQAEGQPALRLYARSEDEVFIKEAEVTIKKVEADGQGKWTKALLEQKVGGQTVKVELSRGAPFQATKEQQEALVGTYFSPELKVVFRLYLEQDRLVWEISGVDGQKAFVRFSSPSKCTVGMTTLNFDLDEKGQAKSLKVDAGRATGMKFEKLR